MLTISSGFEKAEIETTAFCATATIALASKETREEVGQTAVNILVDPETYWSAADLIQLAEYLNIIASELDEEVGTATYDDDTYEL